LLLEGEGGWMTYTGPVQDGIGQEVATELGPVAYQVADEGSGFKGSQKGVIGLQVQ
jgi:hypothetical protein